MSPVEPPGDTPPDALETLNQAAALSRPEPKRDRWGRYIIPHPTTGKPHNWTRATTWAKTCADTFGLTRWELRMATLGLARRPDLLAKAATVTDPDDPDAKKVLNRVADAAKEAAGSSVRANLGTALHSFTEQLDAGTQPTVPDVYQADLDAYQAKTVDLVIDPDHIERIVTVADLSVAGTFDRLVTFEGRLVVADLKTGRDLSYAWGEIAIQLALYAHAETIWDQASETHIPMPKVDQTQALVIHLPVGEGRCTIHRVDIAAGWDMAQTCGLVRDWRKRKDLAEPVTGSKRRTTRAPAPGPVATVDNTPDEPADRETWIRQRLTALGHVPEAREWLARLWPADLPKPKDIGPDGWTDQRIDAVAAVCASVEAEVKAPFHTGDPALVVAAEPKAPPAPVQVAHAPDRDVDDDGAPAPDDAVTAMVARVQALDDHRRHRLVRWSAEANRQGRPWSTKPLTVRTLAISTAAIACVANLWDADGPDALTRAALAETIGNLDPAWHTGAVLGALTFDEATRLHELAAGFAADDDTTVAALGARLVATPAT